MTDTWDQSVSAPSWTTGSDVSSSEEDDDEDQGGDHEDSDGPEDSGEGDEDSNPSVNGDPKTESSDTRAMTRMLKVFSVLSDKIKEKTLWDSRVIVKLYISVSVLYYWIFWHFIVDQ